jgi:hypothetical protein
MLALTAVLTERSTVYTFRGRLVRQALMPPLFLDVFTALRFETLEWNSDSP